MIVLQFLLTLATIYIPAIVGIVVFAGLAIGGLFLIDEWESTGKRIRPSETLIGVHTDPKGRA